MRHDKFFKRIKISIALFAVAVLVVPNGIFINFVQADPSSITIDPVASYSLNIDHDVNGIINVGDEIWLNVNITNTDGLGTTSSVTADMTAFGCESDLTMTISSADIDTGIEQWTGICDIASGTIDAVASTTQSVDVTAVDGDDTKITTVSFEVTEPINNIVPTISNFSLNKYLLNRSDIGTGTMIATIDFGEDMATDTPPAISFSTDLSSVSSFNACLSGWASSTEYIYAADILDSPIDASAIDITVQSAKSLAGNEMRAEVQSGIFNIDLNAPVITGNCLSVSGNTGTGGAFKNGDSPVFSWDNLGCDANADIVSVDFDNSIFSGTSTVLAASNTSAIWSATMTDPLASIDNNAVTYAVTVIDDAGNTTSTTSSPYLVDTIMPDFAAANPVLALKRDGNAPNTNTKIWYYYPGQVLHMVVNNEPESDSAYLTSVKVCVKGLNTDNGNYLCDANDFNNPGDYIDLANSSSTAFIASSSFPTFPSAGVYVMNIELTDHVGNKTLSGAGEIFTGIFNIDPLALDPRLNNASSTDWTLIDDFTNVSGLTFNADLTGGAFGKMEFNENIDLTSTSTAAALADFLSNVDISGTTLGLNSSILAALNKSTTLTWINPSMTVQPGLIVNGNNGSLIGYVSKNQAGDMQVGSGPSLSGFSWNAGEFTFTTDHFTSFNQDTTAPDIAINGPADDLSTSTNDITFDFQLSEDGSPTSTCDLYDNGSVINTYSVNDGVEFIDTMSGFSDGGHSWQIVCTDLVGNTSTSTSRTFSVDTVSPTINNLSLSPVIVYGGANYVTDSLSITADVYDAIGISGCSISLDGGATYLVDNDPTKYNASSSKCEFINFDMSSYSMATVTLKVYDFVGHSAVYGTSTVVNVDVAEPEYTNLTLTPEYNNGAGSIYIKDGATLTSTGTDLISPIMSCEYNIDDGSWLPATFATSSDPRSGLCTATLNGLTNGTTTSLKMRFFDLMGYIAETAPAVRTVDNASPIPAISLGNVYGPNTLTATSVAGTATDSGSGVKSVEINVVRNADGWYWNDQTNDWQVGVYWLTATGTDNWNYDATIINMASNGTTTVNVRATDNLDIVSTSSVSTNFMWDQTNPTINNLSVNPITVDNGINYATGTLNISADVFDAVGISGCGLSLDGGATFAIDNNSGAYNSGNNKCEFLNYDVSGLSVATITVKVYDLVAQSAVYGTSTVVNIDTAGPVVNNFSVSPEYDNAGNLYIKNGAVLTATATDAVSPVVSCEYNINNGSWVLGTLSTSTGPKVGVCSAALSGLMNGTSASLKMRFYDLLGNITETSPLVKNIDNTSPTATISLNGYYGGNNLTATSVVGTATDSGSGVKSVEINIKKSNGYWNDQTGLWQVGIYWITASGTDNWSYDMTAATSSLSSGITYTINVRTTDNLDTISTSSVNSSFVWDQLSPVGSGIAVTPTGNGYTTDNPTLSAIFTDAYAPISSCQYRLNGGAWQAATWTQGANALTGTCSDALSSLTDGNSYDMEMKAFDAAGNSGTTSVLTKIIDAVLPSGIATIATSTYYTSSMRSDTINGTSSDTVSGVSQVKIRLYRSSDLYSWNGSAWASGNNYLTANGTTTWSYDATNVSFGTGITYTVEPIIYDFAGNIATGTPDTFIWSNPGNGDGGSRGTPSSGSGSTPSGPAAPFCQAVEYEDWNDACINGIQHRNIKTIFVQGCTLTPGQQSAMNRSCENKTGAQEKKEEKKNENKGQVKGVKLYPNGSLIRGVEEKKVYVLVNGQRKIIRTIIELQKYKGQKIINMADSELLNYPVHKEVKETKVLGKKLYLNGTLLKSIKTGKIYVIKGGKKALIKNLKELAKYPGKKIVNVDEEVLKDY